MRGAGYGKAYRDSPGLTPSRLPVSKSQASTKPTEPSDADLERMTAPAPPSTPKPSTKK